MPVCGVASVKGLRLQPAQLACFYKNPDFTGLMIDTSPTPSAMSLASGSKPCLLDITVHDGLVGLREEAEVHADDDGDD